MKIYTLFANGDMPEAVKSWKEMNSQVVEEIKDIIRKRESNDEEDEDEKYFVEENFFISDESAKRWTEDSHLSELVWSDDCDDFWITSSEL